VERLYATCQGSCDLSETHTICPKVDVEASISIGFFHTRSPEKDDTGGGEPRSTRLFLAIDVVRSDVSAKRR